MEHQVGNESQSFQSEYSRDSGKIEKQTNFDAAKCLQNKQVKFAVKGCKKRLTSLFCRLPIAYVLVVYTLKSGGLHINIRPR